MTSPRQDSAFKRLSYSITIGRLSSSGANTLHRAHSIPCSDCGVKRPESVSSDRPGAHKPRASASWRKRLRARLTGQRAPELVSSPVPLLDEPTGARLAAASFAALGGYLVASTIPPRRSCGGVTAATTGCVALCSSSRVRAYSCGLKPPAALRLWPVVYRM